jgi:hypothetical protein
MGSPAAFWTGGYSATLDPTAGNWLASGTDVTYGGLLYTAVGVPEAGDPMIFSTSTPGYVQAAAGYASELDGITFGDVIADDGSNCIDGGMIAGDVFLTNNSVIGGAAGWSGWIQNLTASLDGSSINLIGYESSLPTVSGTTTLGGSINSEFIAFNGTVTLVTSGGWNSTNDQFNGSGCTFAVSSNANLFSSTINTADLDDQAWMIDGTLTVSDGVGAGYVLAYNMDIYLTGSMQVFLSNPVGCFVADVTLGSTISGWQVAASGAYMYVTYQIDPANIIPGNIKSGKTILGVQGSMSAGQGLLVGGSAV